MGAALRMRREAFVTTAGTGGESMTQRWSSGWIGVGCLCLACGCAAPAPRLGPPVYGPTNPAPAEVAAKPVRRFGSVIGLNPEKEAYYRELHAQVWPAILERLRASNIRNYSIYITELEGKPYLFSYFEYAGDDFEADMKAMADDPETRRWWAETDPCQRPLPHRAPGAQWSGMEMVFLME
jgi:L-rhamnose mutarotase